MKKYVFVFMLVVGFITPALALNFVDAMACKRVVLHEANNRTVLVNRLTGEVKYALQYNGQWATVQGEQKKKYQSIYNAQINVRKLN